ncbi:MAG: hypothetical protein CMO30_11210 [Tistrella sp.]|nr:hypothetical protein [Tistrella sp.]
MRHQPAGKRGQPAGIVRQQPDRRQMPAGPANGAAIAVEIIGPHGAMTDETDHGGPAFGAP